MHSTKNNNVEVKKESIRVTVLLPILRGGGTGVRLLRPFRPGARGLWTRFGLRLSRISDISSGNLMAPRRKCNVCGSQQWRKEPATGLVVCSEGHVLQVRVLLHPTPPSGAQ